MPRPARYSGLALWHLLSLDAPTVAAIWTIFISWSAGVRVSWVDPCAMFLAVWILYVADRLLDAKPLFTAPSSTDLEERHRFHHRHRRGFLLAMISVALPLVMLLHRTGEAVLHLYILLASLLGIWLLLVHARPAPSSTSHRLPKELAVGIFFPAAVFIPTVARAPSLRPALAVCAFSFALLCTLNCLFLFAWEHPTGEHHAHPTTRWAVRHLPAIALAVSVLPFAVACLPQIALLFGRSRLPHAEAPLLACSLSAVLLLLLHAIRRHIAPLTLRAVADLVLLPPVPLVLTALAVSHYR